MSRTSKRLRSKRDVEIPVYKLTTLLIALLVLSGCSSIGTSEYTLLLEENGWREQIIPGTGLPLRFWHGNVDPHVSSLHIYVGGDGRAFLNRHKVSRDPTPKDHLSLRLAMTDSTPAGFLGRPCYYGTAMTEACSTNIWTADRFSPMVIDSVVAAVYAIGERYPNAKLTLIGYSGGGVIAMMAALQLERVSTVVTVASPLDTAAWTNEHGYTPLAADSNPADVTHWPERLQQIHLVGLRDDNVDAALMTSFLADIPPSSNITVIRFPDFDHSCCWLEAWPDILQDHGLN